MIIIPKLELDNDDGAWLAGMAAETGVTLKQLCESLLVLVVADERALRQSKPGDAA
jgi:hypothetical protein